MGFTGEDITHTPAGAPPRTHPLPPPYAHTSGYRQDAWFWIAAAYATIFLTLHLPLILSSYLLFRFLCSFFFTFCTFFLLFIPFSHFSGRICAAQQLLLKLFCQFLANHKILFAKDTYLCHRMRNRLRRQKHVRKTERERKKERGREMANRHFQEGLVRLPT